VFERDADDPHKIGYYLHLTSSAALKAGDSSRGLWSRCWFAVHWPGIPEASPRSHGVPCRGSVPDGAGARLVLADSLTVSLRTDIPGEGERRFLPRPERRDLHAAILMTADGGEALWRTCVCPFMRVAEH